MTRLSWKAWLLATGAIILMSFSTWLLLGPVSSMSLPGAFLVTLPWTLGASLVPWDRWFIGVEAPGESYDEAMTRINGLFVQRVILLVFVTAVVMTDLRTIQVQAEGMRRCECALRGGVYEYPVCVRPGSVITRWPR